MAFTPVTIPNYKRMLAKCLFGDTSDESMAQILQKGYSEIDPQSAEQSAIFVFHIRNMQKRILNRTFDTSHYSLVTVDLELTAIGIDAEALIQQTLFWDERTDVAAAFAENNSQLMNTARTITAWEWFQDGLNTTMAYTTTLKLVSVISLEEEQDPALDIRAVLLAGQIKMEG